MSTLALKTKSVFNIVKLNSYIMISGLAHSAIYLNGKMSMSILFHNKLNSYLLLHLSILIIKQYPSFNTSSQLLTFINNKLALSISFTILSLNLL